METIENANIFDSLKVKIGNDNGKDMDGSTSETSGRLSIDDGNQDGDASSGEDEETKRKKQKKTERELKKLAFDNKKFNLDASDADFCCIECGETFLYKIQLKSHGVYIHFRSASTRSGRRDSDEVDVVRYQCNACSLMMRNVQSYLDHFEYKKCKDSNKRRLQSFDSCVCFLCGYATTRCQLKSHLTDSHVIDMPTLKPTNVDEVLFACPMCTSDGGGKLVVSTGVDLLYHLSTWHPTAVTMDRGSPNVDESWRKKKTKKRPRSVEEEEEEQQEEPEEEPPPSKDYKVCRRCHEPVLKAKYAVHRKKCYVQAHANRCRSTANSKSAFRLIKSARSGKKKLLFPIQKSSLSALKPASIQKLQNWKARRSDSGGFEEQPSGDAMDQDEDQSTSTAVTSMALPRNSTVDKVASVWAVTPRPWKRSYCCMNCRKLFNEPLGYFIHMVNRFCHGNRGQLQSSFCPLCNEAVKSAPSMLEHVRRVHCGSDGLRVGKSDRVEFSELASEIIGYVHICRICSRGFITKNRCNSSKPHFGSKVPLQEVLICKLCGQRVKSGVQLTLHLWAMHDFGTSIINKATRSGVRDKMVKMESISDYFGRRTYEAAKKAAYRAADVDVPSLLKCSSCTTRFASMAALLAHNKEFHDGARKDDAVFQTVAKIFFYRQGISDWSDGTLFDDMFNADQTPPEPAQKEMDDGVILIPTKDPDRNGQVGVQGVLPIMVNRPPIVERVTRKRKATHLPPVVEIPAKTGQPIIATFPKTPIPTMTLGTVVVSTANRPILPRLVRIPSNNNAEVITLDDDEQQKSPPKQVLRSLLTSKNKTGPPNVVAPPPSIVVPAAPAPALLGPVVLRAYSVSGSTGLIAKPVAPTSQVMVPQGMRLVWTGNQAEPRPNIRPRPPMQNQHLLPATTGPRVKIFSGLPVMKSSGAAQVVRLPAPASTSISSTSRVVPMSATATAIPTRPKFMIRPNNKYPSGAP